MFRLCLIMLGHVVHTPAVSSHVSSVCMETTADTATTGEKAEESSGGKAQQFNINNHSFHKDIHMKHS